MKEYQKAIRALPIGFEKDVASRYMSSAKRFAKKNPDYSMDQLMLVRHILTNHCGIDPATLPPIQSV